MATKSSVSNAESKAGTAKQVETKADQPQPSEAVTADSQDQSQQALNLTGRAVFAVETTAAGVVVRTAFLTEDKRLLDMPAIFPDLIYAMNVIDDLRRQVMQHFSQAAQVGAQVIANQTRSQQKPTSQGTGDTNTTTIKG